ncbi:hypothetical protein IMZ48_18935 [Candidatus Bathyarchaeota archaeon]|nr:hypothetical protein [Candidatus Bathyarchaeota archaeon]
MSHVLPDGGERGADLGDAAGEARAATQRILELRVTHVALVGTLYTTPWRLGVLACSHSVSYPSEDIVRFRVGFVVLVVVYFT